MRAVVLVLHGGKADSREPSRPWHLSAVRLRPFARRLRRELEPQGVDVRTVRYRVRGWNGADADPVADGLRALEQARSQHGPVPVVLLGHSMGGRAALRLAPHPSVRAVTALGPWLPDGEPADVGDVLVRLVHGTDDRWTSPRATGRWAARAEAHGADVAFTLLPRTGHFMLRRTRAWHRLARDGVVTGLAHALDRQRLPSPDPTGAAPAPNQR